MAYERKDLQGAAFKNDKKELDWHADFRGDILVGGVDYYLDITKKVAASGSNYLRVTLKPKSQDARASAEAAVSPFKKAEPAPDDDFDF